MKVFIVDDEILIREGLKVIIKNKIDCEIIGEASNGKAALEYIKQETPDLIITDIRMPIMDGIELIKAIKDEALKVKLVVLSGFDDYQYVREALKNGAVDYILKPVVKSELLKLLYKIEKDIASERNYEKQSENIKARINNNIDIIESDFFRDLINANYYNEEEINKKLEEFELESAIEYILFTIKIDIPYKDYTQKKIENKSELYLKINSNLKENFFVNELRRSYVSLREKDSIYVLLFDRESNFENEASKKQFKEKSFRMMEELRRYVKRTMNYNITIGTSAIYNDLTKTYNAFKEANLTSKRRFYVGGGKVITCNEKNNYYVDVIEREYEDKVIALINSIEFCNLESTQQNLRNIFQILDTYNLSPDKYREILMDLIERCSASIKNFSEILKDRYKESFNINYFINNIDTLEEIRIYLSSCFNEIVSIILNIRNERGKKVISDAKEYIHLHYDKNILLKDVADKVYLSQAYFSDLFKKEVGMNFSDYLAEVRINAARKYLVDTEYKVYEIGSMVGYNEAVSFNRAFKKIIGITPAEYRKLIK